MLGRELSFVGKLLKEEVLELLDAVESLLERASQVSHMKAKLHKLLWSEDEAVFAPGLSSLEGGFMQMARPVGLSKNSQKAPTLMSGGLWLLVLR